MYIVPLDLMELALKNKMDFLSFFLSCFLSFSLSFFLSFFLFSFFLSSLELIDGFQLSSFLSHFQQKFFSSVLVELGFANQLGELVDENDNFETDSLELSVI